ncbi:MAG TPA: serine protease [Pirellulales bacterium]|nr:serine protease [Pirellulales bacterium]
MTKFRHKEKGLLIVVAIGCLAWHSEYCPPAEHVALAGDQESDTSGDGPTRQAPDNTLSATEVERRVMALYDRVEPAIVRWNAPDRGGVRTGVIVTAEGHVLVAAVAAGKKLTFQLSDGRNATGTALGWSGEWNVGLAKLDGQGPWPHIELSGSASIRGGHGVVTLGYASEEPPGLVHGAFLAVGSVITAAPGLWFTTSDLSVPIWRDASIVFNLDGSLAGVGWTLHWVSGWWGHGRFYTDAKVVRALWDDLASGKNRDLVLLRRPDLRDREKPDSTERDGKKAIPQVAEKKVSAVTVRIRRGRFLDEQRPWGSGPGDHDLSGVIVSADGIVATCAHHFVIPGKEVTVCLPDGRDAPAKVLGINPVCDISLMRILEPGPWPFVELGDSLRMRPGDPCLSIGYGPVENQDRQPSARASSVAASETGEWEYLLGTDPSITLVAGDSGGGIFDADGRLIAIHHALGSLDRNGRKVPHTHVRVEVLREHWEELNAPLDRTNASSLATAEGDLKQAAHGVGQSVVEVLDGQKSVAVGTVVGRDGQILTKASLLPEAPACRLFDGRVFPATVVKTIREHDLAILKIGAENLPFAEWSGDDNPRTGAIVAVTGAGGELAIGFVSHPEISIPPERGDLWVNVRDSPQGLEIVEVYQGTGRTKLHNTMLQKGDVILTVDGHPTPDLKAYRELFSSKEGDPIAIAGDQLRLAIAREGKMLELLQLLDPAELPQPDGQSPRYSGFARAYNVTVDAKSPLGGPVVDRTGRVLGVAIAWRARGWLLVLPGATAKTIIEEMERD